MTGRRRAVAMEVRLRLHRGSDIAIGPGKADLLDAIEATGSISAAARQLGMSYRRAWLLVETMNRCFRTPLVRAKTGGQAGGGAAITALGRQVAAHYRALQRSADRAVQRRMAKLLTALKR